MLWNPLNDAAEYRQVALDKRNRGGGHAGPIYQSVRTMIEQQMVGLNPLERALFEARYRFKQEVDMARDNYNWTLRQDLDPDDIPF
jgi:hypothetical protein